MSDPALYAIAVLDHLIEHLEGVQDEEMIQAAKSARHRLMEEKPARDLLGFKVIVKHEPWEEGDTVFKEDKTFYDLEDAIERARGIGVESVQIQRTFLTLGKDIVADSAEEIEELEQILVRKRKEKTA